MTQDEAFRRFRAVLMPRGLLGIYGLGYVTVTETGISYGWSGRLFRTPARDVPWSDVTKVVVSGPWVHVRISDQVMTTSAFVFGVKAAREALVRWAPPGVLNIRGRRQPT
jgi:hypothetical protein